MLEREFMKSWIADVLKGGPGRYWLRIPDTADGIKPFDGILWLRDGRSIAIEFKVWRYHSKFDFSSVRAHQMKALLEFQAKEWKRESWIVVYHDKSEKTKIFKPSKAALKRILSSDPTLKRMLAHDPD